MPGKTGPRSSWLSPLLSGTSQHWGQPLHCNSSAQLQQQHPCKGFQAAQLVTGGGGFLACGAMPPTCWGWRKALPCVPPTPIVSL